MHSFRKVSKKSVLERMMKNKLQIGELSVPDRAVNEPSRSFYIHGECPYYTRALMKASSRALTFQNLLRLIFLPIDKKFLKIRDFGTLQRFIYSSCTRSTPRLGGIYLCFPGPQNSAGVLGHSEKPSQDRGQRPQRGKVV